MYNGQIHLQRVCRDSGILLLKMPLHWVLFLVLIYSLVELAKPSISGTFQSRFIGLKCLQWFIRDLFSPNTNVLVA